MMARMYPNRLRSSTQSHAEKVLYEAFRTKLPNSYSVFHSVSWLLRERRGSPRDGEADFVIAHPTEGLLIIEVKGGRSVMMGWRRAGTATST